LESRIRYRLQTGTHRKLGKPVHPLGIPPLQVGTGVKVFHFRSNPAFVLGRIK
jgi:hypothetical protein